MKTAAPHISAGVQKVFMAYCHRRVRRDFHGLRILKNGPPPRDCTRPLVVYFNHPSTGALETTQEKVAAGSLRRDTSEWLEVNRGKSGVNGIYDAWRWLRARLRGKKFNPEHPAEVAR